MKAQFALNEGVFWVCRGAERSAARTTVRIVRIDGQYALAEGQYAVALMHILAPNMHQMKAQFALNEGVF
jgi:hypothetical protein